MKLNKVLLPTAYLPNLAYVSAIVNAEEAWIEGQENYIKQSYRNRAYILSANGPIRLSVPVLHHGKVPVQELEIDYKQPWQVQHWRAIQSAYAKAPFFEHFSEELRQAVLMKEPYLFAYNLNILRLCLKLLGIKKELGVTSVFEREVDSHEIWDGRAHIHSKNGLKAHTPTYFQCFGEEFVQNLSIIDLLFCEGPMAMAYLKQTVFEAGN